MVFLVLLQEYLTWPSRAGHDVLGIPYTKKEKQNSSCRTPICCKWVRHASDHFDSSIALKEYTNLINWAGKKFLLNKKLAVPEKPHLN